MKADLTRSTFRPEKHYSGVRMQQGRVQLDADWNEHVDIDAHLDETTRIDVIGRCGMPEDDAGFGVAPAADGSDLLLSPGRAYVDGVLCESDASPVQLTAIDTAKAQLASLVADGRRLEAGDWLELSATGAGPFTVRLSSADTGTLGIQFAPALSAADATALDAAKDAVARRIPSYLTQPDFPGVRLTALEEKDGTYLAYLDAWQRHMTTLDDGRIREVALGGPDTATRTQTIWQVKLARLGEPGADITCASVPDWSEFIDRSTGLLRGRAQPETTSGDPCTIPPGAGYRRLENQLYRVEIHDGGNVGAATFKWSRENGSVVVAGSVTDTDELTVSSLGRDEVLGLAQGQWVELTDDTHELAGEPGRLLEIKGITNNVLTVDVSGTGPLDPAAFAANPKVRRWDGPNGARTVTVPAASDGFLGLEDGVEVRFEPGGHFNTGDYWLLPARTAGGDVEWPENGASPAAPLARPAEGIRHHYCKLALLRLVNEKWELAEDCRKLFPPLTGLGGLQEDQGIHVTQIRSGAQRRLRNDSDLLVRDFVKGIEVVCDGNLEPNTLTNKPTFVVTLDLPFPMSSADQQLWGRQRVGTMPLTLNGIVRVSGARFIWRPTAVVAKWLVGQFAKVVQAAKIEQVLLHVTLKGNFVYGEGDPELNVDGEPFGLLRGGMLDVALPSGDRRRGGNLELWFWLRTRTAPKVDRLVLVPTLQGRVLTTKARRAGVSQAISLIVDRARLQEVLPDTFKVDEAAKVDPERARASVARLRLAEAVVRVAVEESQVAAADLIIGELQENEVPVTLSVVPVADIAANFVELVRGEQRIDLVLASEDAVRRLTEAQANMLFAEAAVTL